MATIQHVYRQNLPALRFIGKRYTGDEQRNGTFSYLWGAWFAQKLFAPLEQLPPAPIEDADAYIGLCICRDDNTFEYWIGMFRATDAPVPSGYADLTVPAGDVAVCWVQGREPDIYTHCCLSRLREEGFVWAADAQGVRLCFERYVCPRFTEPDADGNVILDQVFYGHDIS